MKHSVHGVGVQEHALPQAHTSYLRRLEGDPVEQSPLAGLPTRQPRARAGTTKADDRGYPGGPRNSIVPRFELEWRLLDSTTSKCSNSTLTQAGSSFRFSEPSGGPSPC